MKKYFILLLTGFLFFSSLAFGQESPRKICVVGFERRDFPVSDGLKKIFKKNTNTHLVIEAGPQDLEKCLKEDFDEIILVTHAFFVDGDKNRVTLGYFQELKDEARKAFIETNKNLVLVRLKELGQLKKTPNNVIERRRLLKLLERINETPDDLPLYTTPQILFSRFFELLTKLLQAKKDQGTLKLKKFRLMTCASDVVIEKYPFFMNLIDFGVELDVAPSSRVASFFKGYQVTNLNGRWLKESL